MWVSLPWLDHHGHGALFDAWQQRHPQIDIAASRKFKNVPIPATHPVLERRGALLWRCCRARAEVPP